MKILKRAVYLLPILILALALNACNTVAQKLNKQAQASFDPVADSKGNFQNSGLIGFTNHQAIITPNARARYNALTVRFGSKFTPPTLPDAGLTPFGTNLFFMDKFHFAQFATMTTWANLPAIKKNQ